MSLGARRGGVAGARPRRYPLERVGTTPRADGFSIRLAARMTGISEETLRMWERRYTWPRPRRTPAGARVYNGHEIERLVWIRRALERGFRAGAVVDRPQVELERLVERAGPPQPPPIDDAPTVASLIDALKANDSGRVRELLRTAAMLLGARRFVVDFAVPACVAVGDRWAAGELLVHHEHLFTAALTVQLKLVAAGFQAPRASVVALLTTLPGARHALALELVGTYLASKSVAPLMLGAETPVDQILLAARAHGARVVGIGVTPPIDVRATEASVLAVAAGLRKAPRGRRVDVWLGGAAARELRCASDQIRVVDEWPKLDAAIDELMG